MIAAREATIADMVKRKNVEDITTADVSVNEEVKNENRVENLNKLGESDEVLLTSEVKIVSGEVFKEGVSLSGDVVDAVLQVKENELKEDEKCSSSPGGVGNEEAEIFLETIPDAKSKEEVGNKELSENLGLVKLFDESVSSQKGATCTNSTTPIPSKSSSKDMVGSSSLVTPSKTVMFGHFHISAEDNEDIIEAKTVLQNATKSGVVSPSKLDQLKGYILAKIKLSKEFPTISESILSGSQENKKKLANVRKDQLVKLNPAWTELHKINQGYENSNFVQTRVTRSLAARNSASHN